MTAMERIAALKKKIAAENGTGAAVSSQPSTQSNAMQRIQALKAKIQTQEQQGQNAAFTHSGLSRDAFDSSVRENYGRSNPDSSYANVVRGANTLNVQNTALSDLENRYGLEKDATKKSRIAQQYNDKLDVVKKRYQQYELDLAGYQLLQQNAQDKTPAAPVAVDKSAIGNQDLYTGGLLLPVQSAAQATRDAAQSAVQQSASKLSGYDSLYTKYKGKKLNSTERNEVFSAMQQLTDTMNDTTATTQDRALARGEWEKLKALDLYSSYLTYPVGKFATGFTQGVAPVAGGILQTVGDVASAVTGNQNTGSKGIAKLEQYFQNNPGETPNINTASDGHYISRIATATGVDAATVQSYLENERGAFTRDFSENTLGQTLNPTYKKVVGTVAEQIGQQVPGILLTSGAAAGEGAGGLASKLMNGESLKSAVKTALGGNAETVLLGANAYSQQLHNLARQNKVGVGAYADSIGTGFIEYFTEGLFGFSDANSWKAIFSGATGNTLKTVLKDFGKLLLGSGEEGLEEVVGDPMERALDKATVDHSIPMFGKGGVIDPQQMLSDGVTAATTALVMGGFASVSGMYSSYRESLDIQQAGEQLNHIIDQYNAASGASIPNVDSRIMTQEQMDTKAAEVISGWADYANRVHTQALSGNAAQTAPQTAQAQSGETTPENAQTAATGEFNREGAKEIGSNTAPERNPTEQPPVAANAGVSTGQGQTSETSAGTASAVNDTQAPNANGQRNTPEASLASTSTAESILPQSLRSSNGNILIDTGMKRPSVGAAEEGFSPYSQLQNQTDTQNFHDDGANAARVVDVPKTNFEGRSIPESAKTIMGARAIDDADVVQIEKEIAAGKLAFDTITDKKSVAHAQRAISEKGFDGALEQYRNSVNSGVSSKDNTTLGQQLLLQAMREGNSQNVSELLSLYTRNSTTIAQSMQAQAIFRKLSPEGQLVSVQRAVSDLGEKYDVDLTIPQEDIDEFLNAGDEEGRNRALDTIYDHAAAQIPGTFGAKFDTIRYLAMLGNPKTHIRNILGNTLFQIPVSMKNRVGAVGEEIANIVSGGKIERTKSILPANPAGALAKECFADWKNARDFLTRTNKYADSASGKIEERQKAFTKGIGKGIQTVADANTALLELEDNAAKRWIYSNSLAGYLKANGTKSISEADSALLNRARSYAAQEALKGTFNDTNALSSAVSKLGRLHTSDNLAEKAIGYLVEGELPFKKTPANIVMRGLEYSPGGFVAGISQTVKGAKAGDSATVTAGIDHIASGVSGAALLAAGALLKAAGYITGGDDEDDKKQKFWELQGHQNYALEIGGKSFTLDWLSPSAIPFFMGVQISKSFEDSSLSWDDLLGVIKSANDPLLEMTMLQSLNDTFDSAAYAKYSGGSVIGNVIASAATNYLTQVIPTLGGQIERSGEETRKTTFTDKSSPIPSDVQYLLGTASQKIPGWDYNQTDYIDAWGRKQDNGGVLGRVLNNFLNPSYVSDDRSESVDKELQRLYDAGLSGVLPERVSQSAKVGDQYMTQGEYTKYSTEKGQKALSLISEFMGGDTYKDISDEARAAVIRDIYSYSTDRAKKAVMEGRGEKYESNWDSKEDIRDLPDYLAVKEGFADASESRNFDAVDALLHDYNTLPNNTKNALGKDIEKAAAASEGGVDSKKWFSVQDTISSLTPESGKATVSTKQQYAAISDMDGLSEGQKLLVMFGFDAARDNTYEKYDAANKAGIATEDWTTFTGKLDGNTSQAELKTAINSMSWSRSQKAAAWKIYSDAEHWKAANPWG